MTYITPNEAALGVLLALTSDRLYDFLGEVITALEKSGGDVKVLADAKAERKRLDDLKRAAKEQDLVAYYETLRNKRIADAQKSEAS